MPKHRVTQKVKGGYSIDGGFILCCMSDMAVFCGPMNEN